ncbi:MAG: C40 family peptidase [Planctomycetaceae bacterium]|nr:C40 family peptidase [Planctomycetaceae bacterium]
MFYLLLTFAVLYFSFPIAAAEKPFGVVTVSVANLREKPGYAAEMGTQCLLGMPVKILGSKNNWLNVDPPEGYPTWVTEDSLTLFDKDEFNRYIESPKVIFLPHSGFCYSEPNENSPKVADLVAGCVVQNIESENNFIKVKFPDGRTAFVPKNYCRDFDEWKKTAKPTGESLAERAFDFMGTPYLWGGTSSKMLDCSGLTKYCFFLNGVVIPRNASQQAKAGIAVPPNDYKEFQKGDLLFFGNPATDKVSHVGMYLEDGTFIHESGGVHLSSLNTDSPLYDAHLKKRLIVVRRFLGAAGQPGITPVSEHPLYKNN